MNKITVKDVLSWGPCIDWTEKRLRFVLGKGKTPLEICNLEDVSAKDKLWCLLREKIIPAKQLHLFACNFAEKALEKERKAGREPDKRSWNAIQAKRDWLDGKITDEQLTAAEAAARDAARDATWAAAWAAARAATWDAAWAAARDAARDEQLSIVHDWLKDQIGGEK